MNDSLQITVAFVLYMILFGWIGYRRGFLREMITLIVSIGGFFTLQQSQKIVLNLINLLGKFWYFAKAGGLAGNNDAFDQLRTAPALISAADGPTAIFLIWAALLLLTYIATSQLILDSQSRSDFTAVFLGIVNGLFYITVFLPLLVSFILPEGVEAQAPPTTEGVGRALRTTFSVLENNFAAFWNVFGAQQGLFAILLLTVILVAVANTLRRSRA